MGVEARGVRAAEFRDRPPADPGELALVRAEGLAGFAGQGEPEADVHVPRLWRAHGLRHREEERPAGERRVWPRGYAELFRGLAADGGVRVLAGLDVAAGWQPQAGQPVVAQQHAARLAVGEQEVRHQVRRGGAGLRPAEDVICAG